MQMVPVSAQGFGNFFEGDCYIVLFVSTFLADLLFFSSFCESISLKYATPAAFSLPDKWEQGLRPVDWHSLLDRKHLLSGRARCSSHLRHPAGRVPGQESGPAQGGTGQRVATVQELLQKRPHVSESEWGAEEGCDQITHTHTLML